MSPSSDIVAILTQQIQHQLVPAAAEIDLTPDYPLIASGLLDSLTLFRLVTFVQNQFQIKIRPAEIRVEHFATIDSIERLITEKRIESNARSST